MPTRCSRLAVVGIAVAVFAGCGGSQSAIGAPGAMAQAPGTLPSVRYRDVQTAPAAGTALLYLPNAMLGEVDPVYVTGRKPLPA